MYAKSTRPSAKREVQKERSAKRAMRMCPPSGQIFFYYLSVFRSDSTNTTKLDEHTRQNGVSPHGSASRSTFHGREVLPSHVLYQTLLLWNWPPRTPLIAINLLVIFIYWLRSTPGQKTDNMEESSFIWFFCYRFPVNLQRDRQKSSGERSFTSLAGRHYPNLKKISVSKVTCPKSVFKTIQIDRWETTVTTSSNKISGRFDCKSLSFFFILSGFSYAVNSTYFINLCCCILDFFILNCKWWDKFLSSMIILILIISYVDVGM